MGIELGQTEGCTLGCREGWPVGCILGSPDGCDDGCEDGIPKQSIPITLVGKADGHCKQEDDPTRDPKPGGQA